MKQEIEKKIKYWTAQERKFMKLFIQDNKRSTRDQVIKIQERLAVYEEILTLIKQL